MFNFKLVFQLVKKSRTINIIFFLFKVLLNWNKEVQIYGSNQDILAAHQRQSVLWLCATFLNHKNSITSHMRTFLAWGRPAPGSFLQLLTPQLSEKKERGKQRTYHYLVNGASHLGKVSLSNKMSLHKNQNSERSVYHIHIMSQWACQCCYMF